MGDVKVYNHFLDYQDYHLLKDAFCSDSKDRAPFFYNDKEEKAKKSFEGFKF